MKKFLKFLLIFNICILLVFSVLYFKDEINGFINAQTDIEAVIPTMNFDWIAFWKKDDEKGNDKVAGGWQETQGEGVQVGDNQGAPAGGEVSQVGGGELLGYEKRMSELKDNTVIGISYTTANGDPSAMAIRADRIVKIKVISSMPVVSENAVHSKIQAKVQKTFKGKEADDIQFYSFGATVNVSELKNGQIKETASKTDNFGENVTVLMDFCESLQQGKEYIAFLSDKGGIISPICGNMSFFKIEKGNAIRRSYEKDDFSMKLRQVEKQFLK